MSARNNRRRRQHQSPVTPGPQIVTPGTVRMMPPAYLPGPLADTNWVAHNTPGQIQLVAVGGQTRVERLAGQIAAGLAADPGMQTESIIQASVDIAEGILSEISKRAEQAAQEATKGDTDGETREAPTGAPHSPDSPLA